MVEGNDVLFSPERIKELVSSLRHKESLPHWQLLLSGLSSSGGIVLSSDNTTTTGNLHELAIPYYENSQVAEPLVLFISQRLKNFKAQGRRPPACS